MGDEARKKSQRTESSLFVVLVLTALMGAGCTTIAWLQARDQLNKGVKSYTLEQYPEAIGHFERAAELDPEFAVPLLYLGMAYRAQFVPGNLGQENLERARYAITTFERVMTLEDNPGGDNSISAMAHIAGIYQGLNEYDQAKEWYGKRIEIDPNTADPLYGIGVIDWQICYDKTGMTGDNVANLSEEERAQVEALVDEGVESLQKALEIQPKYTEAMQYLNLLYRERAKLKEDPEERHKWEREADQLSLQALEIKKQLEEEAERARRTLTGSGEE